MMFDLQNGNDPIRLLVPHSVLGRLAQRLGLRFSAAAGPLEIASKIARDLGLNVMALDAASTHTIACSAGADDAGGAAILRERDDDENDDTPAGVTRRMIRMAGGKPRA